MKQIQPPVRRQGMTRETTGKVVAELEYQDNLIAGIPPGGVRDPSTVKIMICYLLQRLDRPVTESELIELLTGDQTVNYFLLTTTLASLKKLGHLREKGDNLVLTRLGRRTVTAAVSAAAEAFRFRRIFFIMIFFGKISFKGIKHGISSWYLFPFRLSAGKTIRRTGHMVWSAYLQQPFPPPGHSVFSEKAIPFSTKYF